MVDAHLYLVCPECFAEHTRSVTHCADCGTELVTPDAIAAVEAEAAEFPPASELDCVRVAPLAWVRALSEGLEQGGVAHRVEPAREQDAPDGQDAGVFDGAQLFGLYVRESDAVAARELDKSIAVQLLPDEAPPLAEGEEENCPACGSLLAADVVECGECGLRLG
jgi:hypothetical protein